MAVCRPGLCVNARVTCAVQCDVDQWVILATTMRNCVLVVHVC